MPGENLHSFGIKIWHVHTISDSVLGIVHTTPLRFIHALSPFLDELAMATVTAWKLIDARKQSWLHFRESFRSDDVLD